MLFSLLTRTQFLTTQTRITRNKHHHRLRQYGTRPLRHQMKNRRKSKNNSEHVHLVKLSDPQVLYVGRQVSLPIEHKYIALSYHVDDREDMLYFMAARNGDKYKILSRMKVFDVEDNVAKADGYTLVSQPRIVNLNSAVEKLKKLFATIQEKYKTGSHLKEQLLASIEILDHMTSWLCKADNPSDSLTYIDNMSEDLGLILDKCIHIIGYEHLNSHHCQDVLDKDDLNERLDTVLNLFLLDKSYHELGQTVLKKFDRLIPEREKNVFKIKVDKFLERTDVPQTVKDICKSEYEKLVQSNYGEYTIISYLDLLFKLPWETYTVDSPSLKNAKEILEKNHYGLPKVKDRILEFISVGILTGNISGKILCLVGPPGTGKTSIAKSIAESLHRKCYSLSVAALDDYSEIKGHRRTYVAAMPGRILEGISISQTSNPVMIIDEIDKLSNVRRGASNALLEVLDPSQNDMFLDMFLDIPYDLSKVLFICTANYEQLIPPVLKDRMEVIRLNGYVDSEKLEIAKKYLIPKIIKENPIKVDDDVIFSLISTFCREPGVRRLNSLLKRMMEKASLILLEKNEDIHITLDNMMEFIDYPEEQHVDKYYDNFLPGVSVTLFGNYGGMMGYIESVVIPGKEKEEGNGSLSITGSLDDTMKESTEIAYTIAKKTLQDLDPENDFFSKKNVHMHIPTGGMEKSGGEISCAMALSMISLGMDKELDKSVAFVGEITLTGLLLPVSNLAPLVQAGKRANISSIVLPVENKQQWSLLPSTVTDDITPCFVSTFEEMVKIALNE
eukprot:TRINITY_DN7882_c0_g1_i3.p1 TRINITY_DN7882_c0_g1~~TRINITY_DN7882_c0_g1_i3.p1  ORF type:complete len:786 (+),score=165.12 TRINITY_DN7882_c0_g1_i3:30-2387(+)